MDKRPENKERDPVHLCSVLVDGDDFVNFDKFAGNLVEGRLQKDPEERVEKREEFGHEG